LLLGAWTLVATNLVLAFAAIGLLMRMPPAISTILDRRDVSLEACEQMLAELATPASSRSLEDRSRRFTEALTRAEENVTEEEERSVVRDIHEGADDALLGDADAVLRELDAVQRLASINRAAMREAAEDAAALGSEGAWAVVLLAIVSFTVSLIFIRRLVDRMLAPLEELQETLSAAREGDVHRRSTAATAPPDLRAIMQDVNALLDRVQASAPRKLYGEGPTS
jgi:methyl-accepting chemotaxis protein